MTAWTADELSRIGPADELELQSQRADGTLRDPVTTWVVRHGDELFVRPVRGRDGWYRGTRTGHQGHVRSGDVEKDVTFVDADVDNVTNGQARSATSRLAPR